MVISARIIQAYCTQVPASRSAPTVKNTVLITHSTPAFVITAESCADAGAGGNRVRRGEPAVHGEHTGFGAEADQRDKHADEKSRFMSRKQGAVDHAAGCEFQRIGIGKNEEKAKSAIRAPAIE